MIRKLINLMLTLAMVAAVGALALAYEGHRRFTAPGPLAETATLVVPKGSGLRAIAQRLDQAGIIADELVFVAAAKLRGSLVRAGEYEFPAGATIEQVLRVLEEGRTVFHKLTVAEGLTVRQVLEIVRGADFLTGDIATIPAEGTLLPETWHLTRDENRADVVVRMQRTMMEELERAWAGRAPDLPLASKEEALVLASIVERETGIAAERPRVASVFINRLRLGMPLQSDPTVIYGLSDKLGVMDRSLTRADLGVEHPWNTYVIRGLPPTPIANPGLASIQAVLHPAETKDLYFVADGTGGHVFARTLDEHNRNVANWRRVQRGK